MSERPSLFWSVFSRAGGRTISRCVCGIWSFGAELLDPPCKRSEQGTMLLRSRIYANIPHLKPEPWCLPCGTVLTPELPVLELDLCNRAVKRVTQSDSQLLRLARTEFASLAEFVSENKAVAIVSRTPMQKQLRLYGFAIREMPESVHYRMDTFFRNMYVLAYAKDGAERVSKRKPVPLAEAAISSRHFLERFAKPPH